MIKFIVVEDEVVNQKSVKKVISKLSFSFDEEIDIKYFIGYDKKLEKEIKELDCKKIYILDIELKNSISGIEIASKIRNVDWNSEIIFITQHDRMFETAYRSVYNVFNFIEKFHHFEETLHDNINSILNKNFDNKMFVYTSRSNTLSLFYDSILYVYRDTTDRRLCIITENNTYFVNLSIHDMLDQLDNRFKMCHRACIVNTHKAIKYDYKNSAIMLSNGEKLSFLSKHYRSELEA